MCDQEADAVLLVNLSRIDTAQLEREVDRNLIEHLRALHIEGGKPVSEMLPCFRGRVDALIKSQWKAEYEECHQSAA